MIARGNRPVVVLRAISQSAARVRGINRGKIKMAADFNAPLSDFDEYQKTNE